MVKGALITTSVKLNIVYYIVTHLDLKISPTSTRRLSNEFPYLDFWVSDSLWVAEESHTNQNYMGNMFSCYLSKFPKHITLQGYR
jgi:hypothetical protein